MSEIDAELREVIEALELLESAGKSWKWSDELPWKVRQTLNRADVIKLRLRLADGAVRLNDAGRLVLRLVRAVQQQELAWIDSVHQI
jgi:hypothetical protein